MATILVTGGLGMMGAAVGRALLAAGMRPVIYDAGENTALIADVASGCTIERGDIRDLARMREAAQRHRPDAIVHLAGLVGPEVERDPALAIAVNFQGTVNALECARLEAIGRIMFMSSKMVYGPIAPRHRHPHYEPVPETHPREPVKLYGKLKRACEDVAAHYAARYALDVVALRCGSSFGPGKFGRNDQVSPVMGLIDAAFHGREFRIATGVDQRDDLCYVGDTAQAFVAALESKPRPGALRCYNVASGVVSLAEMIATLRELFPGARIDAGPGLDYRNYGGVEYYFAMDTSRIRAELGFVPRFPFRAAVLDYCEALRRL